MTSLKSIGALILASTSLVGCNLPDEPAEPIQPVAAGETSVPSSSALPLIAQANATEAAPNTPVTFEMGGVAGSGVSGRLTATRTSTGVHLQGRLTGANAGDEHAIHVHERGDCSAADASSAGDHFNPGAAPHGHPDKAEHHAGDLPNLSADSMGQIAVDIQAEGLQLGSGGATDILGRAVVLHAEPDDYSTQPAGASGARIACGVIANTSP